MVDNGINILGIMCLDHPHLGRGGRFNNSSGILYLRMLFNIIHIWVDRG
jgi:hypothetical protein